MPLPQAQAGTRTLRYWAPAILWAVVIWTMSTQSFSTESTAEWIIPLLHRLFTHATQETLESLHFLIRKCGHVVEYLVFSLFLLYGIRGRRQGWQMRWALAALSIAASYAALDEIHQAFVPGRTAAVGDVLLDSSGAALGQFAAWLWSLRRRRQVREPAGT